MVCICLCVCVCVCMQELRGEANVSMKEAHLWHRSPRPSRGWQVPAEDSPWHTNSTAGLCFSRPWGIVQILNTYIYKVQNICILQSWCLHTIHDVCILFMMSVYYSWCLHTIHSWICILHSCITWYCSIPVCTYVCMCVYACMCVCACVCVHVCVCACPKEALLYQLEISKL